MKTKTLGVCLCLAIMLAATAAKSWAAFGEDIEKPKPEFEKEDGDWIARLVPRGKSSPVQIRFHLDGGTIAEVAPMEFAPEEQPRVDSKNFRSDFFRVQADVPTGGAAALSVRSVYFTSATELWGPRSGLDPQWHKVEAKNVGLEDRVNELTMQVIDGGPLDADGVADGRILVVLGPQDSFWGYALGTLFIRFFGIFLVLSILMIGMLLSGVVFRRVERRKNQARPTPPAAEPAGGIAFDTRLDISGELAAAIVLALHLHTTQTQATAVAGTRPPAVSSWSQAGRARQMGDRWPVFNRQKRS